MLHCLDASFNSLINFHDCTKLYSPPVFSLIPRPYQGWLGLGPRLSSPMHLSTTKVIENSAHYHSIFKYTSICSRYTSFQPFFSKFVILSSFGSCKEGASTIKGLLLSSSYHRQTWDLYINLCTCVLKHTGKIQHVKNLRSYGILKKNQ